MADPRYSAPDIDPEKQRRAREEYRPWPRNRDINFDIESPPEADAKR